MYGRHLSRQQIQELIAPKKEVRVAAFEWINSVVQSFAGNAMLSIDDRVDSLKITASVGFTEKMFRTTLAPFRRQGSKNLKWIKFTGTLSVPSSLRSSIDLVSGIVEFAPSPRGVKVYATETTASAPQASYTGDCNTPYTMKRMYSVDQSLIVTNQKASMAPYSDSGKTEGYGEDDLKLFQQINNLVVKPITNIIGDSADTYVNEDTDTEAALDVQCLTGFGNGGNLSFWVMNDWMYEFAAELLVTDQPPLVNSMSYGWYESQQCRVDGNCTGLDDENSEAYVTRTDTEFQKLGVLGLTMLAASGDDGVESDRKCTEMRPDFPASSVYVTSVGATAVVQSSTRGAPLGSDAPPACTDLKWKCNCSTSYQEHAAMKSNNAGFDSGGGFSSWLPRPAYQNYAVNQYLNSGVALPSKQYWNPSNRGYPDVAAVGAACLVMKNGKSIRVGGTSASCPIWGGLITLLNNDRLNSGKSPLGFVNPLLYKMWQDNPLNFIDITTGSNGGGCDNLAFLAAKGWDPLTGLGSPNFASIRAYVAKLP